MPVGFRTSRRASLVLVLFLVTTHGLFADDSASLVGTISDPQGKPVSDAIVEVVPVRSGRASRTVTSDDRGHYAFSGLGAGSFLITVKSEGFDSLQRGVDLAENQSAVIDLAFAAVSGRNESVTVVADVRNSDVMFPDPAQRVYAHADLLDANPGRPGVPISIPGLPAETASGGIKAPQYFAPGVAGDHGEPIAQFLSVGSFLVPNNLTANAHGNGYADPNILVPAVIESGQTDGGSFNVREGNHSVDLGVVYGFHSRLEPYVTLSGDQRDIDLTAGWSPEGPDVHSWLALEVAFGNGFLDRLEHRQQYKLNGYRLFNVGHHRLTIFGDGYYGFSYVPGLVPLDVQGLHDTIDRRQRDQTHTALIAANDVWRLTEETELHLSAFFRDYNLALYSNFGDGLIRQSEYRTVVGGNAAYTQKLLPALSLLAGFDYHRDAPRREDLDHYLSGDQSVYGPFQKVTANDITFNFLTPFVALDGFLTKYAHFNIGFRRDWIHVDNVDLLNPLNSSQRGVGVNSPKGTLTLLPPKTYLPTVAFSFGESFHTNDPRIGLGATPGSPVSRAHAYQLVVSKTLLSTDFRVTLGHITTEQSLAKIDPDTGLQFNEGPSGNRYITLAARRYYRYGLVQASASKADARDLSYGTPVPEAPRLIVDFLGTIDRLPFHLHARAEYEEVGKKPLGDGFTGVPVRELRGSLSRPFAEGRINAGVNFLIASGYTGQTTEVLALPGDAAPFERVVGVRVPSYVSLAFTYHFRP